MKFFDECPDCGSIKTTTLVEQRFDDKYLSLINESYNDIERAWVKCEKCNMIYHNPQLDEDDTKKLYSKFRDKLFREEEEDDYFERIISIPESESENYHKVQWLVGSISNKTLENSKILDVGCGGGVFLHALMKVVSSKHIFGLEPTENFARLAERKLGCTIINDNFEGIISGGEYDLITCNHVLEHSTNPKVFFDTLYANHF